MQKQEGLWLPAQTPSLTSTPILTAPVPPAWEHSSVTPQAAGAHSCFYG